MAAVVAGLEITPLPQTDKHQPQTVPPGTNRTPCKAAISAGPICSPKKRVEQMPFLPNRITPSAFTHRSRTRMGSRVLQSRSFVPLPPWLPLLVGHHQEE